MQMLCCTHSVQSIPVAIAAAGVARCHHGSLVFFQVNCGLRTIRSTTGMCLCIIHNAQKNTRTDI